jgi:glutaredoxin
MEQPAVIYFLPIGPSATHQMTSAKRAKLMLQELGLSSKLINVSTNFQARKQCEAIIATQHKEYPLIFIDGSFIGVRSIISQILACILVAHFS